MARSLTEPVQSVGALFALPRRMLRATSGVRVGELDIAYIPDRCPAELVITETGLPDYCRRWSVAGLGPGRPLLVP
jgi:hypothetical protein